MDVGARLAALEAALKDLNARADAVEEALAPGQVRYRIDDEASPAGADGATGGDAGAAGQGATENERKVSDDIVRQQIRGAIFCRVRDSYYKVPLSERASILGCHTRHLCKTLVMENVEWREPRATSDAAQAAHDARFYSRYYAVIVQYAAKLAPLDLARQLRSLGGNTRSLKSYKFALAPADVSQRLTGYAYNGVSPYGLATDLPIIIARDAMEVQPPFLWFGAGDVDLKLRVPIAEMRRTMDPIVAKCSVPRSDDDDDLDEV